MADNAFILNVINKIEYVAEQIKALSGKGNALSNSLESSVCYLKYLSSELIKRCGINFDEDDEEGRWVTTESGKKVHFNDEGEPDIGNEHVVEAIEKAQDVRTVRTEKNTRCERPVKFENPIRKWCAMIKSVVTQFSHDEDKMVLDKSVQIDDKKYGRITINAGDILHLTVIGADDLDRKCDKAEILSKAVGGNPKKWKKVKGIGTITDNHGKKVKADIHWFENEEVGQVGWKVKSIWRENESKVYWGEQSTVLH